MTSELIVCIPGNWKDRADFIHRVVGLEPTGRYMFAGTVLADVVAKDHVPLDFCPPDPLLGQAFAIAAQGQISPPVLALVEAHTAVVYLHFPIDILAQRERVLKYTELLRRLGGLAVKVESSGVAHEWKRWFGRLSGNTFDVYTAMVTLIGGEDYFYSCGMHHFGLPECEVPASVPLQPAADLMNRFNFWQIVERPRLENGHTFSLTDEDPRYHLYRRVDARHREGDLFWNTYGVWRFEAV